MVSTPRVLTMLQKLSALGRTAAEMAFYFALSFVPFLGLATIVALAWLPADVGGPLAGAMAGVFPSEAGVDPAALAAWVGTARRSGLVAAGVLLAAWSSFRFMTACVRALAEIGGVDRLNWGHRLRSLGAALLVMLLWMLALFAMSFVLLVAPGLQETLAAKSPLAEHSLTVAALVRVLAGVVLLVAVMVTYRMIPGLGARGWRLRLASLLATAGWVGVAVLARRALPALWAGQSVYGTLGSFIVFLLLCWANAWVLLACGVLAGRKAR